MKEPTTMKIPLPSMKEARRDVFYIGDNYSDNVAVNYSTENKISETNAISELSKPNILGNEQVDVTAVTETNKTVTPKKFHFYNDALDFFDKHGGIIFARDYVRKNNKGVSKQYGLLPTYDDVYDFIIRLLHRVNVIYTK